MKRFECVDDQNAAGFPVTSACEAAGVSTSGYYDWCEREAAGPTERQLAEAELVAMMRQLFDDADGNYGVPRMFKTLRNAVAESFSESLKRECIQGRIFAMRAEARRAIFKWINWCNTTRLHSTLDHVAPLEWEQQYHQAS